MKGMTRVRGLDYLILTSLTVKLEIRFLLCKHHEVSSLVLEYPF